jgi:septal ring factor EnvC (AmiA/AmiB activator)
VLSLGRVLLVAVVVALVSLPVAAGAQNPNDRVAKARAAVDAAAQRWFDGKADLAKLNSRIGDIEARVADAQTRADKTASAAQARAVALYKGTGTGLAPVLAGNDALESARRAELLDRANEASQNVIDEYVDASQTLKSERANLVKQRAAQEKIVKQLAADQQQVDQHLTIVEAQAAKDRAAIAAKAARARSAAAAQTGQRASSTGSTSSTAASTTSSTDGGGGGGGNGPSTAPPPVAPPPSSGGGSHHNDPFLVCTRARESRGNYGVVSASGIYYGAYQFSISTWNITANHAGRIDLVGVPPNRASVADQDDMAWTLYQWQGKAPWGGRC